MLNPKQKRFVQEYLKDLNATKAAERAGYSKASARSQAYDLLTNPHIAAEVEKRIAKRQKRTEVTQDKVVKELARIAFADQRHYVKWGPDGAHMVPSGELSKAQSRAVAEVSVSRLGACKLKLHDKTRALELLGKHLGMFTERVEQEHSGKVEVVITDYRSKKKA